MVKADILAAYEKMAEKYNELIYNKPHNAYYDRPNTLQLLPDANRKTILDTAYGPDKYAEILMAQGAIVTSFDINSKMVALAIMRNNKQGEFFIQDLSAPLDKIKNNSCDEVLCALPLHYIEDWFLTIKEFNRVLKTNGILVISIEHPFLNLIYSNPNIILKLKM